MGMENFILECEKDNEELNKKLRYLKNKNQRLQQELSKKTKILDELKEYIQKNIDIAKPTLSISASIAENVFKNVLDKIEELERSDD